MEKRRIEKEAKLLGQDVSYFALLHAMHGRTVLYHFGLQDYFYNCKANR